VAGKTSARRNRARKPVWQRRLKQITAFGAILFLAVFATSFTLFLVKLSEAESNLQQPQFMDRLENISRDPTKIVTADGIELYRVANEYRLPVRSLEEVPEHVVQAVLAAEDKRFYDHPGVDSWSLMRAFTSIFRDGRVSQGGSTLTMQLAKQLFSESERSLQRKVQDIAYAYAIEKYKTKDQILLMYLNHVYFGQRAHGIKAAAHVYFNKKLEDLTIDEAAMLARCVRTPSRDNPVRNMPVAMANRNVVLRIMREENFISEDEFSEAMAIDAEATEKKLNPNPPQTSASYPANIGHHLVWHALDVVRKDMPDLDLEHGGYTIHLTIDSKLQKLAEDNARKVVKANSHLSVNQAAFIAMDADGRILAEVGGVDFNRNEYNYVTQGSRQPGSAFKTFVYAVGFATGNATGPDDHISNAVITRFDPWSRTTWSPRNHGNHNAGSYTIRQAFLSSINRPAIHMIDKVGPQVVAQYVRDSFGLMTKMDPVSPLALGTSDVRPLELLEAYSVFMLRGDRARPFLITRIVAPDGTVVRQYQPSRITNVFNSQAAAMTDAILHDAAVRGTGRASVGSVIPTARGKTGTTNSAKDVWFCGYADGIVAIAWAGNEQLVNGVLTPVAMRSGAYGGTIAGHIWAPVVNEARKRFGREIATPAPANMASTAPAVPPVREAEAPAVIEERPISDPVVGNDTPVPSPTEFTPPPAGTDTARRDDEARRQEADSLLAGAPKPARPTPNAAATSVSYEICVDSSARANMYCPETVTRTFSRANAPTRVCRLHGPG
jgi:penicillin-binding protein 1A